MESRHLFDDRYSTRHRQPHHQQLGQLMSQRLELSDMFGQMSLGDEFYNNNGNVNVNIGSVPARVDNLVPWSDLGHVENNVNVNHMLYQNGGSYYANQNFGNVYGDFESRFYRDELWRRQRAVSNSYRGLIRLPYRNEVGLGSVGANRIRGMNGLVANCNNSVSSDVNLMDLRGQIFGLATDQVGCKMLQNKFMGIKHEEIEMIMDEVVDHLGVLMMDQFGSYLVQKLIEVCSEEQMTRIVHSVAREPYQLISVCFNVHGARVVQKLMESIKTNQQISELVSALIPGVCELIKDANAHHVIHYCLKNFSFEHIRFLAYEIARNCYDIATDKNGCCIVQTCVDNTKGQVHDHLISEIVVVALPLSEDCYGNYVVQHLLLTKDPTLTARIVNELRGHFFSLACNKYGSNVVEKCLTATGEECSKLVIMELLRTPNVSKLLMDPFGNYVFQSALSVSQGVMHATLVNLVNENSTSMCTNLYGKKILAWFGNDKRLSHMHSNLRS